MFLKPTWVVQSVLDIDLERLQTMGIQGFIFDLDNTIMAPHTGVLEPSIAQWLTHIQTLGFKCMVVSNNPLVFYTQQAEETLQMPVIGNAAKPRRRMLRKALELLQLPSEAVAVVGDRPLTDIWGGQRLGAKTILVDPLTKSQENKVIQTLRKMERWFIHPEYH